MSLFLTILAAGVITYVTRASLIVAGDRVTLPDQVERVGGYLTGERHGKTGNAGKSL